MQTTAIQTEFSQQQLETMINGAAFLGSGGGGPTSVARQLVRQMPGTVKVASIAEAAEHIDHYAAVVAYIGSPNDSRDVGIDAPCQALSTLDLLCKERFSHQTRLQSSATLDRIGYVLPVETGVNAIVACVVANHFDIPIIDGDGAGRAVPLLSMLSYAFPTQHTFQTVLANEDGDSYVLRLADVNKVEKIAGPLIELNQHKAGLSLWPMRGRAIETSVAVPKTLSACLALGTLFESGTFVEELPELLREYGYPDCKRLISARISAVQSQTANNLDSTMIDLVDDQNGQKLRLINLNENLLAWSSESPEPVAYAPQLICWVTEKGQSFSAADIDVDDEGNIHIGSETNPIVHVFAIEPNRFIQDYPYWPQIQKQFVDVVSLAGYPLPQMRETAG